MKEVNAVRKVEFVFCLIRIFVALCGTFRSIFIIVLFLDVSR